MKKKALTFKVGASDCLTHAHISRGITLVALVVTIVVLLILSGVTISTLLGENGIIKKAQEAADKMKEETEREQQEINDLIDKLGGNSGTIKEVIAKTEDTITVVAETEQEYEYYQFSIDGTNWTEMQTSNTYTFSGLEKTIVDETNYSTTTGKEYTVYTKAIKNSDTVYGEKKVKLPVEVDGNADYFSYTDLGDEILITGFAQTNILPDDTSYEGFEKFINEPEPKLIPSYINGKPVTKIATNLILENISKPIFLEQIKYYAFYNETLYMNNVEGTVSENGEVTLSASYYLPKTGDLILYGAYGNMHGKNIINSDSESPCQMALQINANEIVIPPTVTEFYDDISTSKEDYITIQKANFWNNDIDNPKIQKLLTEEIEIEIPTPPSESSDGLQLTVLKDSVQNNDNAHVTFLGRENLQDITNSNAFEEAISQSTNYTIEYID